ncbi:MAG TPA: hypothetical protein ENJ31_10525, partial [Anaerolineae bacterium]|nr:hypothetical protein [Anaerolineae bacterium]
MDIQALTQVEKKARWLRLGRRLFGERSLLWAGRLFYRLRIEGEEHIPATGACLFAFNHVAQPVDLMVNVLIRSHRSDVSVFGLHGFQGEEPVIPLLKSTGEPGAEALALR